MRISSPGTHFFSGNTLFQLFQFFLPISSHSRGKKASFWGGTKKKHPRVVHVLHQAQVYDSFRPLGKSFSVIFTLHSSCSSLDRMNQFVSRIKYKTRGTFYHNVYSGRTSFPSKITPDLSITLTNPNLDPARTHMSFVSKK